MPVDLDRDQAEAEAWEGEIVWVTKRWLNQVFRELRQARKRAEDARAAGERAGRRS